MQCFRALGQFIQITFENFGKAVEQCPERPGVELLVSRIAPLSQDRWDLPWPAGLNVRGADDEIVCRGIRQVLSFVGTDPLILVMPPFH